MKPLLLLRPLILLSLFFFLTGCRFGEKVDSTSKVLPEYLPDLPELNLESNSIFSEMSSGMAGSSSCKVLNDGQYISSLYRPPVKIEFSDQVEVSGFQNQLDQIESNPLKIIPQRNISDCGSSGQIGRNKDGLPFIVSNMIDNGCQGLRRDVPEEIRQSDNIIWRSCLKKDWQKKVFEKYDPSIRAFRYQGKLEDKEIIHYEFMPKDKLDFFKCSIDEDGGLELFKINNNQWESVVSKVISDTDFLKIKNNIESLKQSKDYISIEVKKVTPSLVEELRDSLILKMLLKSPVDNSESEFVGVFDGFVGNILENYNVSVRSTSNDPMNCLIQKNKNLIQMSINQNCNSRNVLTKTESLIEELKQICQ